MIGIKEKYEIASKSSPFFFSSNSSPNPPFSSLPQVSKEEGCLVAWSAPSLRCAYKALKVLDTGVETLEETERIRWSPVQGMSKRNVENLRLEGRGFVKFCI